MSVHEVIIVGGGVAGLSCLNALIDRGQSALLLESGRIGTPKICGEFISPLVAKQLQSWGISSVKIREACFRTANKDVLIDLPEMAGAISRPKVELSLQQRALSAGAKIHENISVTRIITPRSFEDVYSLYLSNDEILYCKNLIIATGKFNQSTQQASGYIGVKFHLPYIAKQASLIMHCLSEMYLGLVPINDDMSNCAALIRVDRFPQKNISKKNIVDFIHTNETLQKTFGHFEIETIDWLQGVAPAFQRKQIPRWPNAFWIGDALATLYPAIGAGFAQSIYSAVLAAACFIKKDFQLYEKMCKQRIKNNLFYGKMLHHLFLQPKIANKLVGIAAHPLAVYLFLRKIGYFDNYFWNQQCNIELPADRVLQQSASQIPPIDELKKKLPDLLQLA